jgi:O-antigen/teichoic acid export membrane protein
VIGALTPVLLPLFSELLKTGDSSGVLEVWHRATRKGAVVLFGLFFFFVWLAPEFLVAVYSNKYRDSSLYLRIYLLLLPVRVIAFMPLLFALGRRNYVMVGSAIEVVLNLTVSLILIRGTGLGMAGAAVGTVAATIWQAWFYLGGIRRGLGVGWRNVLPWSGLARDFVHAAMFFLPLALLKIQYVRVMPEWMRFAFGSALYAVFVWYVILPRLRARKAPA